MKTLHIAAVDDLVQDQNWLTKILKNYMTKEGLEYTLSVFSSGEDFLSALETCRFDIVFMDIYMKGITGVEAAKILRTRDKYCKLVFLTTSDEFMRQGFALNSSHYLIKPVKEDEFRQAMENCQVWRQAAVPLLSVPIGRQMVQVDTTELYYIDMENRSAMLHTASGNLNVGRSFSAVSELLSGDCRFLLCNKALLINMDYIVFQDKDCFCMKDGARLPIAPRRKQDILAQYRNYIFGNMGGVQ